MCLTNIIVMMHHYYCCIYTGRMPLKSIKMYDICALPQLVLVSLYATLQAKFIRHGLVYNEPLPVK